MIQFPVYFNLGFPSLGLQFFTCRWNYITSDVPSRRNVVGVISIISAYPAFIVSSHYSLPILTWGTPHSAVNACASSDTDPNPRLWDWAQSSYYTPGSKSGSGLLVFINYRACFCIRSFRIRFCHLQLKRPNKCDCVLGQPSGRPFVRCCICSEVHHFQAIYCTWMSLSAFSPLLYPSPVQSVHSSLLRPSVSSTPWCFPSLVPSALLLVSSSQACSGSSTREACSHIISILCMYRENATWDLSVASEISGKYKWTIRSPSRNLFQNSGDPWERIPSKGRMTKWVWHSKKVLVVRRKRQISSSQARTHWIHTWFP